MSPQRITHYRDNWYLDAWDHDREALRSFAVDRITQARLLDEAARDLDEAVLDQQQQLELEIKLTDASGRDQHLWLVLRLPVDQQDYHAVILSISDITSRKLIELSLQERESFWSDVVRTVPDHLYVQNVISQRIIFSNHHLGH